MSFCLSDNYPQSWALEQDSGQQLEPATAGSSYDASSSYRNFRPNSSLASEATEVACTALGMAFSLARCSMLFSQGNFDVLRPARDAQYAPPVPEENCYVETPCTR